MLSKMKPVAQDGTGGSRLAIVFNGSPLFTGAAGSGESEIRRWILENDWLEAIIALPDQLFYNTGISTYIWLLTNRKAPHRRGKVQLINGVNHFQKTRKSLGDKRKELSEAHIADLARLYAAFTPGPEVKLFDTTDFGFSRITVERPLRLCFQVTEERLARLSDDKAWQRAEASGETPRLLEVLGTLGDRVFKDRDLFEKALKTAAKAAGLSLSGPILKALLTALGERDETAAFCRVKGEIEPDPDLRDTENVPLKDDIDTYVAREVLPHVPDAWVDGSKTKVGYEIPFTRHFYVYEPPRPLAVIEGEIRDLEREIQALLGEVLA